MTTGVDGIAGPPGGPAGARLQAAPISVAASAAALLIRMFMTLSYGGKFDADPAARGVLAHNYVSGGQFCNSMPSS